jgi:hypothetical protein
MLSLLIPSWLLFLSEGKRGCKTAKARAKPVPFLFFKWLISPQLHPLVLAEIYVYPPKEQEEK